MMDCAASKLYPEQQIENSLIESRFSSVSLERYFIDEHLMDGFVEKVKFHPNLCLDISFRANTSTFALAPDKEEIEKGLVALRRDIASGDLVEVMNRCSGGSGEFYYILARKT